MVIEAGDSAPNPTLRKGHDSVSYTFHSQDMQLSILIQFYNLLLDHPGGKIKGKGLTVTCHEGTGGEQSYSCTDSHTSALDEGG